MEQKIINIPIKDLVLWTENPRDPINAEVSNQDIVNMAFGSRSFKWELPKLAKAMGNHYDFSELPTVVYHGKKPVVYDGNRRMILGKIKLGFVAIPMGINVQLPEIPDEIPCNVCAKKIALENVYRKHSSSGSWDPLERDIFLHKFMGEKKSTFLVLNEDTGIITANPHLNQGFVKDEIFKEDTLKSMGFPIKSGRLNSVHNHDEEQQILSDISEKIKSGTISTRKSRKDVFAILDSNSQRIIDKNKNNSPHLSTICFKSFESFEKEDKSQRQSKRSAKKSNNLFGGKLYVRIGDVSNLYRDITDLYAFYKMKRNKLSPSFPGLIRMSLRLLCETAAKDCDNTKMEIYLKDNFEEAKKTLNQNIKTTLSSQNVKRETIVELLHIGAHNYESAQNIAQTVALSIIIGAILTRTHGKEE